jgi:hypothetical protein
MTGTESKFSDPGNLGVVFESTSDGIQHGSALAQRIGENKKQKVYLVPWLTETIESCGNIVTLFSLYCDAGHKAAVK